MAKDVVVSHSASHTGDIGIKNRSSNYLVLGLDIKGLGSKITMELFFSIPLARSAQLLMHDVDTAAAPTPAILLIQ